MDDAFLTSPEAMLLVDTDSAAILRANDAAARLLGRDDLERTSILELHPEQTAELLVFTEAVITKRVFWTRHLAAHHAAGHQLELEYQGVLLETGGLLLTLYDLEKRRQRDLDMSSETFLRERMAGWSHGELFIREVERQNQLILRAAGEGIYGLNTDGQTSFVNPAAERILGWTAEQLVGRDMHQMVHHHHADGRPYKQQDCPIYAAFRDGVVRRVDQEVFWHRDGHPVWVDYTSTPIRDRDRIVGAVVVFRDVTQRRENEAQLKSALAEIGRLRERLEQENAYLQEEIRLERDHRGIIGQSAAIRKTLSQVELVAPTQATVLITGESGTGKELIARAIHEASDRRDRPMIRVNCAAIPRELFESEFFGHARGAFSGAVRDRIGRFELADGGTLFLDEVGEIPLELQSKLLRVLQEGQFERVGEERTRSVDVRVIAATNRDLRAQARDGRFREDLYFRLDVFPIAMIPLRERPDDIPPLALHFLRGAAQKLGLASLTLTEGDVAKLQAYSWPGNVRELQNVIERAAILARDNRLRLDLPSDRLPPPASAGRQPIEAVIPDQERRRRDRDNIIAALRASGGKVSGPGGAAALLGVRPTTLASRIKAWKIQL